MPDTMKKHIAKRMLPLLFTAAASVSSGEAMAKKYQQPTCHELSDKIQVGVASYYHPGLDGRRTASGDIFRNAKFTAAHKKVPMGTIGLVTNKKNGKTVVVEFNDRGPFVKGRIVDLSKNAAQKIGMGGTTDVKLQLCRPPLPAKPDSQNNNLFAPCRTLHDWFNRITLKKPDYLNLLPAKTFLVPEDRKEQDVISNLVVGSLKLPAPRS